MPNAVLKELPGQIDDWSSLAKAQDVFRRAETAEEWVFRGLSDETTDLKTTLELVAAEFEVTGNKVPDLEVKLVLEFMRRYHLYALEPPPTRGDTLDWLALMRHHGAPSRLLDFTFSFLVAAYFALERSPKGTPTVWCVNKSWLTTEGEKIIRVEGGAVASQFTRYQKLRDGNAFRNVFLKHKPKFVYPCSPFRLNQRLTIQQGLFLCPGDVTKPFHENLRAMQSHANNVKAIPIKPAARAPLLAGLLRANLSRATLFPGLDGFATSLWTKAASLKQLQSMEDSGARIRVNLDIEALRRW